MKAKQDTIKIYLRILVFVGVAIFIYSPFHELIHMLAVKAIGYNSVFNFSIIFPVVSCINCQSATYLQLLFINIAPHLVSLIIIIFALFTASKLLNYVAYLAFFDLFANFMGLVLVLIKFQNGNDFINLITLGRLELVITIGLLTIYLLYQHIKKLEKPLKSSFSSTKKELKL